MTFHRVLVLSPHTDDAELGCGATIARMVEEQLDVHVAVFSTAQESLPPGSDPDTLKHEFLDAMPTLGLPLSNLIIFEYPVRRLSYFRQEILEKLVCLQRTLNPDLVLLPSGSDVHQDHQVIYAEGLRAFRDASILGYELPWNHITFSAQAFAILQKRHLERKWQALQVYRSQRELGRPYFSREFIESLARVRGTQVKAEYAEAYEVVRIRL